MRMNRQAMIRRLGHLTASVEAARSAVAQAHRGQDLLSDADRALLGEAAVILAGIEQRLWERKE